MVPANHARVAAPCRALLDRKRPLTPYDAGSGHRRLAA